MIIKCQYCKREFETNKQRKQHEKDAHPKGGMQYFIEQAERMAKAQKNGSGK